MTEFRNVVRESKGGVLRERRWQASEGYSVRETSFSFRSMKWLQLSQGRGREVVLNRGRQLGALGGLRGNMRACSGSLFALRVLQGMQEVTTLSQLVRPLLSRGLP